jgi:hypothetical protein
MHMTESELSRRGFNKLTVAAFGGMVAGSFAGCGSERPTAPAAPAEVPTAAAPAAPAEGGGDALVAAAEIHLCRGLNTCKGKGADKENACAGQGSCATAKHHSCGGDNECKGLGGCGANAGANDCKGKGGCHVPLMESAWETVRGRFEKKMTAEKKEFGKAPPPKAE